MTHYMSAGGQDIPDRLRIAVTNRGYRPGELAGAGLQLTPEGKSTCTWMLHGPQLGEPKVIDAGRSVIVEGAWSDFVRSARRERVRGPATVAAVEIHISGHARFDVHRLDSEQRAELSALVSDLLDGRRSPWKEPNIPVVQEPILDRLQRSERT